MKQTQKRHQKPNGVHLSHPIDSDYWDNGTILFEGLNDYYNELDRYTADELYILYLVNSLNDDDPEKAKAVAEWKEIEARRAVR